MQRSGQGERGNSARLVGAFSGRWFSADDHQITKIYNRRRKKSKITITYISVHTHVESCITNAISKKERESLQCICHHFLRWGWFGFDGATFSTFAFGAPGFEAVATASACFTVAICACILASFACSISFASDSGSGAILTLLKKVKKYNTFIQRLKIFFLLSCHFSFHPLLLFLTSRFS